MIIIPGQNENQKRRGRRISPFNIALYHFYAAALGNTNIWPTMFGRCTWQMYVIVPGLFATNDTVWICPLTSSKVSTPSTLMT